ncbi:MAG: 6-phosphogluconolactonase [Pseudomonadota bacterium]
MQFIDYADRDLAAMGLADAMASALKNSLLTHETASLAVPGGTTPGPVFDILSAADLAWDWVTVLLTDERWVPEDHERSNAGLIRARLLQNRAAEARFLPYYRTGMTVPEACAQLSTEFAPYFPLSLLVLGMGADMHTASLFPGADGLDAALRPDAPAVCAISTDSQPEPRITLSAPVLNGALEKHLVIFGDDKKAALENAKGRAPEDAPISAVMQGGTVHWAP